MTITQSDLDVMGKDIKNLIQIMPTDKAFWGKFFNYYNKTHAAKIGMGCRPCYSKVYNFIRMKFEQQKHTN